MSIVVEDIEKVPGEFKMVTITATEQDWLEHIGTYEMLRLFLGDALGRDVPETTLLSKFSIVLTINKSAIEDRMRAGVHVPGARLRADESFSLEA